MNIGFIGAGKVGTAFGLFLKDRGQTITGYTSRTFESACKAAHYTSSQAYENPLELMAVSDLVILTTQDDQIEPLAIDLAGQLVHLTEFRRYAPAPLIVVHMSGAHSVEILRSLEHCGCEIGALHPLQSVSEIDQARITLGKALFSIETPENSRLENWVKTLNIDYVKVDSENKALYHIAAVFASNYLVTVMDTAIHLFQEIGFSEEEARRGLMPLIRGSVANVERSGTVEALTGPIARGDCATVKRHLERLKDHPKTDALYRALAAATLSLAKRQKFNKPEADIAIASLISKGGTTHER